MKKFSLVERAQIERALEEIKTSQSGLTSSEDAPRIGELIGANILVVGDLTGTGSKLEGTLRILKAETGVLIGSAYAKGSGDQVAEVLAQEAAADLSLYLALENPDSPYSVLLKLEKEVYKVGDVVKLKFKVLKHGRGPNTVFIQIFSIDEKGTMTRIYPNRFVSGGRIDVDKEYTFPTEKDDFEWEIVPPTGEESIHAIVTMEPIEVYTPTSKSGSFRVMRENGNSDVTYRGIQTKLNKDKLKDWAADRVVFRIAD